MTPPTPATPPLDVVTRARAVLASGMAAGKPREVLADMTHAHQELLAAHETLQRVAADLRAQLDAIVAARTEAKPAAADDPHGLGAWWKRADTLFAERWDHVRGSAIGRISSASLWTAWDDTDTLRADNVPTACEAARLALGQPAEPVTVGAIDWDAVFDPVERELFRPPANVRPSTREIFRAIVNAFHAYDAELRRTGAIRETTGGG